MEILRGEQMRSVDARTIRELGIPSLLLMESAGREVAESLIDDFPNAVDRALILCGKGNNGGDGLVAARHLVRRGGAVEVLVFGAADQLSDDATVNLRAARASGVPIQHVLDEETWLKIRGRLDRASVVLDALLGTGIRGGARGLLEQVIQDLNASPTPVAAVDLPSGVDADSPQVAGMAVLAARTYALCRPKPAHVLGAASRHTGDLRILPIGIPPEAIAQEQPDMFWLEETQLAHLVPPRVADSHKGTFGHLLAVAGSRDKSGAAVLLARGALRTGVGLMTVATSRSAQPLVAAQQAELMSTPLDETARGAIDAHALQTLHPLLERCDALAIGPGLGTEAETVTLVRQLLERADRPAVIDADALNALAQSSSLESLSGAGFPRVLTPHPGEAARLLASSSREVQEDRLAAAQTLARRSGAVVVLKGDRSVVADPDGRVAIGSSGNPGMASGGSGDVLTGIIGALLARGLGGWNAACLGTYVHGDSGDRAAESRGEEGMIAADIIEELPGSMDAIASATGLLEW